MKHRSADGHRKQAQVVDSILSPDKSDFTVVCVIIWLCVTVLTFHVSNQRHVSTRNRRRLHTHTTLLCAVCTHTSCIARTNWRHMYEPLPYLDMLPCYARLNTSVVRLAMSTRFLAWRMTRPSLVRRCLLEQWNDVRISTTDRSGRNLLSYEFRSGTFHCLGYFEICSDTFTAVAYTNWCICAFSAFHAQSFVSRLFHPLQYCSPFPVLSFSTLATWSRIFLSRNFMFRIFSVPAAEQS